jgi:hypothetical protein
MTKRLLVMPGFGPAAEILFFREKDPKPLMPYSASLHGMDVSLRRADQLAEPVLSNAEGLKQGSPDYMSINPQGRSAGIGQGEGK